MTSRVQNLDNRARLNPVQPVLSIIVLVGGLSLAEPTWAAYLQVVGPSPIRIQLEAKLGQLPLPLPTPAPVPEPSGETNSAVLSLISNAVASSSGAVSWTARASPPEPVGRAELEQVSPVESETEPGRPVVTPQMLVPFFEHRVVRQDGKETGLIAPLPFVPPRSSTGSSSRAVLRND